MTTICLCGIELQNIACKDFLGGCFFKPKAYYNFDLIFFH
jgi:hypothetical protein